jgi:tRNA1(Val) A37 N6-methylase TrmN6
VPSGGHRKAPRLRASCVAAERRCALIVAGRTASEILGVPPIVGAVQSLTSAVESNMLFDCRTKIAGVDMKPNGKNHSLAYADLLRAVFGKKYSTILADPPWRFQNKAGKVAPEHRRLSRYGTMTLEDICSLCVYGPSKAAMTGKWNLPPL